MKAFIVPFTLGIFALNEKGELIDYELFPKEPKKAAKALIDIEEGKITQEFLTLAKKLKEKGVKEVVIEGKMGKEELKKLEKLGIKVKCEVKTRPGDVIRENPERFMVEKGILKSTEKFRDLERAISFEKTILKVKREQKGLDKVIIQEVEAVEDLNRTINLLTERLVEWYAYLFPELPELVSDQELLVKLIAKVCERENFTEERLRSIVKQPKIRAKLVEAAKASMGADFPKEETEPMKTLAKGIMELISVREKIKKRLKKEVKRLMPNTSALVGPMVSAKLLALAGSLKRLASLPSSTIQVIGSEKALFKHLRGEAPSPKHGVIFQVPLIRNAPKKARGKIARALASKIAIAAKLDYFGGKFKGEELRKEVERKAKEAIEKVKG